MTYQLFEELLFGEGFWLGLILIVAIGLYIGSRVKFSGLLFIIIYVFLAIEYINKLSANSAQMWGIIVCLVASLFSTYQLYDDATNG